MQNQLQEIIEKNGLPFQDFSRRTLETDYNIKLSIYLRLRKILLWQKCYGGITVVAKDQKLNFDLNIWPCFVTQDQAISTHKFMEFSLFQWIYDLLMRLIVVYITLEGDNKLKIPPNTPFQIRENSALKNFNHDFEK